MDPVGRADGVESASSIGGPALREIVHELMLLQEEDGWLPPDRLEALASQLRVPLHRLESVSTFYTHFRREPPEGIEIEVCRDLSCRLAGAEAACKALSERASGARSASDGIVVREVSCLGRCDQAPAAAMGHVIVDAADAGAIAAALERSHDEPTPRAVGAWPAADPYLVEGGGSVAAAAAPGTVDANEVLPDAYRVLRRVVAEDPSAPIERLEAAGLRGMGGAGFPTARKWSLVAAEQAGDKHVVCNADESEPGTFKDRELLHDLPHLVIEGMAIAGFCVGAERTMRGPTAVLAGC